MKTQTLLDKFRAGPWLIATLLMATVVGILYPHQLGVLLWSLTKLSAGAYLGYWIDRSIFYYARPGEFFPEQRAGKTPEFWSVVCQCMIRRAIIMAATILALGVGV
ncbi:MAG: putative holin [Marinobacter sp.]|uniref:putative holin n=1 Tax=Marinobacter sp. TaxID=50741 RepID=UPI00299D742C|nr:putative holin [Marinobacter sp.]MDX1755868.1 putative holin [Marinobacter sp.]